MNRSTILLLALVAASGFWAAHHWDEICVRLGIEDTVEMRAVQLAKSDHTLARHLTNYGVIKEHMEMLGDVEVVGWKAESKTETLYLVQFTYDRNGVPGGFYFEVDVGSLNVRNIEARSDLATKYNVAPSGW